MNQLKFTIHCPVCHMTKINRTLLIKYQGVDHYFCSSQCLERFKAHFHLFVAGPKHGLSLKQKGALVRKKRHIGFAEPVSEELKINMEQSLLSLMGLETDEFEDQCLDVTDDLLPVLLEQIESVVEESAARLHSRFMDRITRDHGRH